MVERFDIESIFHDAQFFTGGIHASVDEISTYDESIRRRTLLMHYADSWEGQKERVDDLGFHGFVREQVYYDF